MFEQFPVLLAPIDYITTVKTTLQGTIEISLNSKVVTGTGTNFIMEITQPGAQIYGMISGNKVALGYVARIINETTLYLEEKSSVAVVSGTKCIAHVYKTGVKMEPNGFLYPVGATPKPIVDFFRRVQVSERFSNNISTLIPYEIKDGETPELVSQRFYNTPFYHWTILMINNIVNPREEWPLTEKQLMKKIELFYPNNNYYDILEYRNAETGYVEEHDPAAVLLGTQNEVSIYAFEFEKNEQKRHIKVIQPILVQDFIRDFYNTLNT